jgi:hypothetical protein
MEPTRANAERLAALFRGFESAHGTYGEPQREHKPTGVKWGIKTSARTLRTAPTIDLFQRHLEGSYPLGIIPITSRGGCFWGSIDVDDYSLNPLEIVQKIENNSYPLIPVSSKSGGLHLFVFLTVEQPASLVQSVLQNVAARLGLSNSEIFPKQTEVLSDRGDVGNWLCLPFLGTTFGGKFSEQTAIKKTGARFTLEEFLNFAEQHRVTPEKLQELDASFRGTKTKSASPTDKEEPQAFMDGPPCLQHLAYQGVPDGGRNSTLFMMGLYYIRKEEGNWRRKLEEANRLFFNPPLDSGEVLSVINSIERKAPKGDSEGYKYTCKTQPMASHCNSKLCRTRKFGIGSSEEIPKLTGISKLNTEPPLWFVNIGDLRIEATTEQLQQYTKFHALCLEKGNVCFRAMRQQDWLAALGDAMQHEVTIIDISPEVGLTGQFKELLEEFLTDRATAENKDELLRGLPWRDIETEKVYFKLSALQSFLDRQNFKAFGRSKITQRIREIGGDREFFTLRDNRGINVWFVPTTALPYSSTPLPLPDLERGPL